MSSQTTDTNAALPAAGMRTVTLDGIRWVRRLWVRHLTRQALAGLADGALADIGLTRCAIDFAADAATRIHHRAGGTMAMTNRSGASATPI